MSDQQIKDDILLATLSHVPFDGWTQKALRRGTIDAGHGSSVSLRLFPGGLVALAEHLSAYADRLMLKALEKQNLDEMRVRDRITVAVRCRLELMQPYREAMRRVAAFLTLPSNVPLATRLTYKTVNAMWYAAGDTATDFNFYTKRGLLSGVYTSTLLYWLNDESGDCAETWSFLDRRIGNVMKIPGYISRAQKTIARLPTPWNLMRALRNTRVTR
jgi:ubiquinone biosynthesis protein COQ9